MEMTLYQRIARTFSLLISLITIGVVLFIIVQWISTLRHQMERQAMDLAVSVAQTEIVQDNIVRDNGYIRIQNYVERLRLKTRIHYVYVVDKNLVLYSHPDPGKIGQPYSSFRDPDVMKRVLLTEEPYVGSSGDISTSVEAAVPVYSEGVLSGVALVGMLNGRIFQEITRNLLFLGIFLFFIIFAGVLAAVRLTEGIKKSIRGLEPAEITLLLGQRELVIENLKEGILYLDQDLRITMFNRSAEGLLGLTTADIGTVPRGRLFFAGIEKAWNEGRTVEEEIKSGPNSYLLARFFPVNDPDGSTPLGIMAGFEDLSVVRRRAEELTGMKELTQALRAQNHEFMNKLHAVSGMIQLGEAEEAVAYISDIVGARQHITGLITSRIRIPAVAGLILSKFNRAAEKKIQLVLTDESDLQALPSELRPDALSSLLGNLVENAVDILEGRGGGRIDLTLQGNSDFLHLSVADNGPGLPPEYRERIFQEGFSTKGANRGFGLYTVKRIVDGAGGEVSLGTSVSGGLEVRVFIPGTAGEEGRA